MSSNVLVIGDMHLPFTHPDYLKFCIEQKEKFKCKQVIFIGDVVDCHALSFHEHDPDGMSAGDEVDRVCGLIREWVKVFPNAIVTLGNHDLLVNRKAFSAGIPARFIKTYNEIFDLRSKWEWKEFHIENGVLFKHGTGNSGKNAALNCAIQERISTVIGHVHSWGGVQYTASKRDIIFGMNVGCGIDLKSYAMQYGKDFNIRPTLGCGVVVDSGKHGIFIPMDLGDK